MKWIIEHLEPRLSRWCMLEYEHMSSVAGKDNLIFTNIRRDSTRRKLEKLGTVYKESVTEIEFVDGIILDPEAEETLAPSDRKRGYIILGGILGDYPPKKRTWEEITSRTNYPSRNLGEHQMPTDTAMIVSKRIIEGSRLSDLRFADGMEIILGEGESIELPFRYLIEDGKPVLAKGLISYLKRKRTF